MASGDVYRAKAAEIMGKAARETNHDQNRANLHALAQSYLRLAEQADRNELTDVTYETPTPRPGTQQPQPQQQQQQQQQQRTQQNQSEQKPESEN